MWDEGVEVVDVDFGLEQGGHDAGEFGGGIQFNDEQITFSEGEVVLVKQFPGAVGVVGHEADDGAIAGVQDGQGEDVDLMRAEKRGKVVKAAEPISGEYGELFDGDGLSPRNGFGNHGITKHMSRGDACGNFPT